MGEMWEAKRPAVFSYLARKLLAVSPRANWQAQNEVMYKQRLFKYVVGIFEMS